MICRHILLITFLNETGFIFLHAVKWVQVLLCINNNSIKHQSFVYIQLNDQTFLFLTIQFIIGHLFTLSLDFKQVYLTHRLDPIRCYHSGSGLIWGQCQRRSTPHSPKFQHYGSLTIRLFSIMSRTPIWRVLPLWSKNYSC